MHQEQRVIRMGMTVLVCALALRLVSGLAGPVAAFLARPEIAGFLVYLETGRVIKPAITPSVTQPIPTETGETQPIPSTETIQQEAYTPFFSPEDTDLVQVRNSSGYSVDLEALLLSELKLEVSGTGPAVLILHTHGSESYTQTSQLTYTPSGEYRTLDTGHNMLRVGEALKAALEARGISVIHDRNLHDYPDYNDAYINSRKTAEEYLRQYPSLCLIIDLHRDAADTETGQLKTAVSVQNKSLCRLMLVVGTGGTGKENSTWRKNMTLAVQLQARMEQLYPGICRPISLRKERFNQDLSTGALLVEVGAAGDTLEQAIGAAEALAEGLADLLLRAGSTR